MPSTRSLFHYEALDSEDNSDDEESDMGSSMDDFIVDSEEETEEDVDLESCEDQDVPPKRQRTDTSDDPYDMFC